MSLGMSPYEQDQFVRNLSQGQLQDYVQNPDGRFHLYIVLAQLRQNERTA